MDRTQQWVVVTDNNVLGPFTSRERATAFLTSIEDSHPEAEAVTIADPIDQIAARHQLPKTVLCFSRGPRIGSGGVPLCKQRAGHDGRCQADPEDGWSQIEWGEPLMRRPPHPTSTVEVDVHATRVWPVRNNSYTLEVEGTLLAVSAAEVVLDTVRHGMLTLERDLWNLEVTPRIPAEV